MNQEQSMSDTKAAKSRTIQLCVRFDERDVELLKTLCREEKQGRHDAIQSLAFRLEASLLSESDDRTGHADDEVSALQELQAENERLTGVCKEFDTLVSRLSRSLWVSVSERMPTEADTDEFGDVLFRCPDGCGALDWDEESHGATHWMPIPPLPAEPPKAAEIVLPSKEWHENNLDDGEDFEIGAGKPPKDTEWTDESIRAAHEEGGRLFQDHASEPPKAAEKAVDGCRCWTCHPQPAIGGIMVVCPDCGNKRCPKATYHGNACTHSNAPGQEGSRFVGFNAIPISAPPAPDTVEDAQDRHKSSDASGVGSSDAPGAGEVELVCPECKGPTQIGDGAEYCPQCGVSRDPEKLIPAQSPIHYRSGPDGVANAKFLRSRLEWYRGGCDGLDAEEYFKSGDLLRDVASDLESALHLVAPAEEGGAAHV